MIIKDPLQAEQTAYELLGVDQTIAAADVHGAFARALAGRPREAKALNAARSVLQSPAERALLDALLYQPAAAEHLTPSPADAEALAPARRQETAAAWTGALRARFPNPVALHSLAVLWYWWAMHASAQPAGAPPIEALWSKALAYWAALLQREAFWRETLGLDADQAKQAKAAMESRLRETLYRLAEQARAANDGEAEGVYQRLRTVFDSELETARHMAAAPLPLLGARAKGFGCGRILLEEVGRLDQVRAALAQGLAAAPGDRHLERVRMGLSACSEAAQLVDARQWQPALDALARLGEADRRSAEARALQARALIGRGQQQASLGDVEEARKSWAEALKATDDPDLRRQAEEAVVEVTMQQAQALASTQPQQAIAALEAGLQLAPGAGQVRSLLGQLLSDQARSSMAKAVEEAERARQRPGGPNEDDQKRWRRTWEPALRKAIAAHERAQGLGYGPAGQRLNEARQRLRQLQAAFGAPAAGAAGRPMKGKDDDVSAKSWQEWAAEGAMARLEKEYDRAVTCLRNALAVAPRDSQAPLKGILANTLANRAVHTINALGDLIESFKNRRAPDWAMDHVRDQVESAKRDVDEAAQLDPKDDYVRKQKQQIDQLYALTHRGTRPAARTADGQGKNILDLLLVVGGALLAWFSPQFAAITLGSGLRLSALLLYIGALGCCLGMRRDLPRLRSGCLISGLAAGGICLSAYRLYMQDGWIAVAILAVVAGWAFLSGVEQYNKAKGN